MHQNLVQHPKKILKNGQLKFRLEKFAQSNPVKFKTLNLTKIIKILNSVSNDNFKKTLVATFAIDVTLIE